MRGSGWPAGDLIFVQIGSASFDTDVVCALTADAGGAVAGNHANGNCTVPAVPNGSQPLVGIDDQNQGIVSHSTFVVSAGFALSPNGAGVGAPTSPGSTVSAVGLGFSPGATISGFKFAGTAVTATPSSVSTGNNGSATSPVTFTVPAGTTAGVHTVTATDSKGKVGTQSITIYAAKLTLSPSTGSPGTPVSVTGSGWPAGDLIFVQIGSASFDTDVVCALTADASGNVLGNHSNGNCTVPAVPNGSQPLVGIDDQRQGVVSHAAFAVSAGFALSPSGAGVGAPTSPGSTVSAVGLGFATGATIKSFKFDGTALATSPTSVSTGNNGSATSPVTFTVPAGTTAGVHTVTATDTKGKVGTQSITIYAAKLTLSPSTGSPGTPVSVTGSGWPAGDLIFVQIGSTSFDTNVVCVLTADAGGAVAGNHANGNCTVPAVPNGGQPLVGIDDQRQGVVSHATFAVSAGFALSPSGAGVGAPTSPGSTVSAVGLGFATGATIKSFKFDGTALATSPTSVSTGNNGSATSPVTFTVPAGTTAGVHTVTATDTKGKVGTQSITIYAAKLTLSPTSGAPGAGLTVTGSGWPAGDLIFIQIGSTSFDSDVACVLTADASGGIIGNHSNGNCTVPNVPAGTEPLVGIDDQNQGIVSHSTFHVS